MKIQNAVGAFEFGEIFPEFLRQLQERGHVAANPVPILGQRIAAVFHRRERMQKRGAGKEIFKRFAERRFFAHRIIFVRRQDFPQNRSGLFP